VAIYNGVIFDVRFPHVVYKKLMRDAVGHIPIYIYGCIYNILTCSLTSGVLLGVAIYNGVILDALSTQYV